MAGAAAAIVNFGARLALSFWLPYAVAIVLAYCLGMATAFVLNRRFVFRAATTSLFQQVLWFVAVNMIALAQTLAISLLLANLVLPGIGLNWHAEEFAHAVGIAVPILTSYVGHKKWTFR